MTWMWLALAATVVMGATSAAGIFLPFVYDQETALWAAQGVGQDIVNLVVILPAMVVALFLAANGSLRAVLICGGLLLYELYSFVLYAFFVHFNALFPLYIAALGASFYALAGLLLHLHYDDVRALFEHASGRAQSIYLMVSGVLFGLMWISSIVTGIASGETPRELIDVGLPVNPVHVLDLAFVLPAMIVASVHLWKRRALGFVMVVPLLVFAAAMGTAIIGMMIVMQTRELAAADGPIALMAVSSAAALFLIVDAVLPKIRHPRVILQ